MNFLLKSISFIFHPLFMPLIGVVFYFSKSPRHLPKDLIYSKLLSLSILTIALPILVFFLLKTLGKAQSIYLKDVKERSLPLGINCVILVIILLRIFPNYQIVELHFFFVAILMSTITCFILALLKFRASLHMTAVTGIFTFFVMIAIEYSINVNGTLALMCIITGGIATSRLYLKAHSPLELIVGCFIGILPQIIVINYWFPLQ
jgi:membrane-associated phospholipid phosphatase